MRSSMCAPIDSSWRRRRRRPTRSARPIDLAERRYEGGIASYLEVLDAQRSLFTAELSATQVRRAYLEATVELYKALGGTWQ